MRLGTGIITLSTMQHRLGRKKVARIRYRRDRSLLMKCFVALGILGACGADTNAQTAVEQPAFRPRTDPLASNDADALRQQLKRVIDARGPVNPLGDYVKPKQADGESLPSSSKTKLTIGDDERDDEASEIPRLDKDAQRRLKSQPPQVDSRELGTIGLLPPPVFRSSNTFVMADDGFRPVFTESRVVPASSMVPEAGLVGSTVWEPSSTIIANYPQNDPAASIPPSLNGGSFAPPPITGLPSYNSVPNTGQNTLPPGTAIQGAPPGYPGSTVPGPSFPGPTVGGPVVNGPTYGPPGYGTPTVGTNALGQSTLGPSNVAPTTIVPGPMIPSGGRPSGIPPANAPSSAVPTYVYPAPPTYLVPAAPIAGPPVLGNPNLGAGSPYANGPLPAYSRTSAWVNSAPFVSPPPVAFDAKWMVSPAVYRPATGAMVAPTLQAGTGSMVPPPGTLAAPGLTPNMGMASTQPPGAFPNTVVPVNGWTPTQTSSPFSYAPPAAMPPQTVYASANGGFVPVVGFGQGANAQLGRGMWGQPTAYVDGQPFKNFLRYVSP